MIQKYWSTTPTPCRCPLDGTLTTIDSVIYADALVANYGDRREVEPTREIGTILGDGHILAADRWTFRVLLNDAGAFVGWWTTYGDTDFTIPPKALALKAQDAS